MSAELVCNTSEAYWLQLIRISTTRRTIPSRGHIRIVMFEHVIATHVREEIIATIW